MSNFQKNSKDYGEPDITYQLAGCAGSWAGSWGRFFWSFFKLSEMRMRQVIKHRDIRLLKMIRRTDPVIRTWCCKINGFAEILKIYFKETAENLTFCGSLPKFSHFILSLMPKSSYSSYTLLLAMMKEKPLRGIPLGGSVFIETLWGLVSWESRLAVSTCRLHCWYSQTGLTRYPCLPRSSGGSGWNVMTTRPPPYTSGCSSPPLSSSHSRWMVTATYLDVLRRWTAHRCTSHFRTLCSYRTNA